MSSGPPTTFSDSRNPAASSRSSPGVRITTANGRPWSRIFERLLDRRAVGVRGPDRTMHADDVDRPDRLVHGAMLR